MCEVRVNIFGFGDYTLNSKLYKTSVNCFTNAKKRVLSPQKLRTRSEHREV